MTQPTKQDSSAPVSPADRPEKSKKRELDQVHQNDEHEGATEDQVDDRRGPGPGFDEEPERERDDSGVSRS